MPCANPRAPQSPGVSGTLNTTNAVCFFIDETINGWGCSSFGARTVSANGTRMTCGQVPMPAKVDGGYYFEVSEGEPSYASFYWWQ